MSPGKRVLVVDDQPDVCEFLAFGLQSAGFEVEVAANGREALERQHQHGADVVVIDIFMPDMDGIEAIDRIKSEYPGTRIVAMSGGNPRQQDYLRVAGQIGVDATLKKPFSADELLAVLLRLTRDRREQP